MVSEAFIEPSAYAYTGLIYCWATTGARIKYGGKSQSCMVSSSAYAYTGLTYCWATTGNVRKAWEVYDTFVADGLEPTLHIFLALIHACGIARDSASAFKVLAVRNARV